MRLINADELKTVQSIQKADFNSIESIRKWIDEAPTIIMPEIEKYDYRYDHTDCIWYRDSKSRCPTTCSQYRDGWNDAMQYIFMNGKGYSPFERQ